MAAEDSSWWCLVQHQAAIQTSADLNPGCSQRNFGVHTAPGRTGGQTMTDEETMLLLERDLPRALGRVKNHSKKLGCIRLKENSRNIR